MEEGNGLFDFAQVSEHLAGLGPRFLEANCR